MKRIALLGSTGSIGKSALQVVDHLCDTVSIVALTCHSNIALLEEQILKYRPKIVAVFDPQKGAELLRKRLPVEVLIGQEGMDIVASHSEVDFVLVATLGLAALSPTLNAIAAKKEVGLANKEVLVSAGELVMSLAHQQGVRIIPIDSEHSALFQCLEGIKHEEISRLILTASGGPFRKLSSDALEKVTLEEALRHPTWEMGAKITVDSSTLMNKGFEVIEASVLFDVPADMVDVVVHPQSVVHSFVECVDGVMLAQIHPPNMVSPIQYALTYPTRVPGMFAPFNFLEYNRLDFELPDSKKFPCLELAFEALRSKGSFPCYLNAANEVLVHRFLQEKISWIDITRKLSQLMMKHQVVQIKREDDVWEIDQEARKKAYEV